MEGMQRQQAWMLLVGTLSDEAIGCLRSGLQHLITVLALQPQSLQHVFMGQGSAKLSKEGHIQLVVSSNKLAANRINEHTMSLSCHQLDAAMLMLQLQQDLVPFSPQQWYTKLQLMKSSKVPISSANFSECSSIVSVPDGPSIWPHLCACWWQASSPPPAKVPWTSVVKPAGHLQKHLSA